MEHSTMILRFYMGALGHGVRVPKSTSVSYALTTSGHRSASFFPWHRYSLAIWEAAMREQCGFTGPVPFVYQLDQCD